jgi:two-component system, NtrC family, sensor kinase
LHDIENPGEIDKYASALEKLGRKCFNTESVAVDTVNYLYNRLNYKQANSCALIRFFRTMGFNELTPALQELSLQTLPEAAHNNVNCLTLLASRGMLPEWNDRFESKNHQVIPLVSSQMIASAPMIAQLINRLGIDVAQVITPAPRLFLNPLEKTYNILYVPNALGDHAIVAQKEFVEPYGIHSVIGTGGLLPTGDMFALMIFMRVFITPRTAKQFSLIARGIEMALNEIRSGKKVAGRILLATSPSEHLHRLRALLGAEHEIVVVHSVQQAIALIQAENFDLIICGTLFDDSRMFELLWATKQERKLRQQPFLCFKENQSLLGEDLDSLVASAAQMVGASCYVDGNSVNDDELKNVLHAYLREEIWTV